MELDGIMPREVSLTKTNTKLTESWKERSDSCGYLMWRVEGELEEGGHKVQTSNCKIAKY